jgi:hypothetical protein
MRLLAYFSSSENKSKFVRSLCCLYVFCVCVCVCVCVCLRVRMCTSPHQLLSAWTNFYETWYVYHGTRVRLSGLLHKWHTGWLEGYIKSIPSICVSVCVSRTLLGNDSINTLPRQWIHAATEGPLNASPFMRPVSYQRIICGSVCC